MSDDHTDETEDRTDEVGEADEASVGDSVIAELLRILGDPEELRQQVAEMGVDPEVLDQIGPIGITVGKPFVYPKKTSYYKKKNPDLVRKVDEESPNSDDEE